MSLAGAYRLALHLYPRAFRREYGDDMVALFESQRRDEGTLRVVGRTAVDLVSTIPTRHLEAHMSRPSPTIAVVVLAALGVLLAVVGGTSGVLAAAVTFVVGVLVWSRNRPVATPAGGRWWKLLLSGLGLLAALIVVTTATGELPEGGWFVAMFTLLLSLLLIAGGLVLGAASRFRVRPA